VSFELELIGQLAEDWK